MSSEYRAAGARWSLWSAVPPRNASAALRSVVAEDVEQGERDDEVLLDVVVVGPWRDLAPADDVDLREHGQSASGSTLTTTCQR